MNAIKKRIQAIPPAHLEQSIDALFMLVIVLQFADAISTYWALDTGQAQENNLLLVAIARYTQLDVMVVVVAAKLIVAVVFFLAMKKSKPTWGSLFVMFGMAAFYLEIVSSNILLTWLIIEGRISHMVA